MTARKAAPKRPSIPQGVRFDVFRRDGFTCKYCGRGSPDVTLELDHLVPVAKGGGDEPSNLVTSCFDCNRGKGTKTVGSIGGGAGWVGLFGHRLDDGGDVQNQFRITRALGETAVLIQLFSFSDGSPTKVEVVQTDDLASEKYTLFATGEHMRMAYWVDKERRGELRGKTAEEAFEQSEWFARITNGKAA